MTEFTIADIDEKDRQAIKKAEEMIKEETGKEIILIAWQSKNLK